MPPNRVTRLAGGIDPWIAISFLALLCVGVLMVYSSSIAESYATYGSPYYIAQREITWAVIGFAALAVASRIDYHQWHRYALPFFGVTLALLILVLVPHVGHMSNGARRWFSLGGGIDIQPSEVMKLALVVYMAAWLTSKAERVGDFKSVFVPFSMIVGLVALLIIREPDLGTAIVVVITMFTIFFVAGANLVHMLSVAAGSAFVVYLLAHSSSYRSSRLLAFTDPWKDPTGAGYHTIQALLALGSGGLFGQGLGNSWQKYVLPAPHTDSILAVIGEEWGVVGTLTILALFVIIAIRGMRITAAAPDQFGRLLACGLTAWIVFQALMNFAVITSTVPFTGVPLPFISYGGSSLVITMVALGILLNISRFATREGSAQTSPHNRGGNGRTRVSRAVDHPTPRHVTAPRRKNVPARSPRSRPTPL